MKSHCKGELKVKAAGGIRTFTQVIEFLKGGANRIGTSSTKSYMRST
ncbi:MAG: hypothetical protein ACUVQ8_01595 [Nitrososphaeria archaeon]